MTLTTEATDLFTKALNRGETALANALGPFIKLETALHNLGEIPDFDWAKNKSILFRESFSREATERMTREALFKNPTYPEALSQAIDQLEDSKSLHDLFQHLMRAGQHGHALQVVSKVEDRSLMASMLTDDFRFWRKTQGGHTTLYALGQGDAISMDTLRVFDALGIDLPNFLSTDEYGRKAGERSDEWGFKRFECQADLVGTLQDEECPGLPYVSVVGGVTLLNNSGFAKAFFEGREKAVSLGGWHEALFPAWMPAVVKKGDMAAISRIGGVAISPLSQYEMESYDGEMKVYPSRGHVDPTGAVSRDDVLLAMSLLGYETLSAVREDRFLADNTLVLLPAEAIPALNLDDSEPSEALSFAMRFHRPEPLLIIKKDSDWTSEYLGTRLYLRGVDPVLKTEKGNLKSLKIVKELELNPTQHTQFKTDLELDWIRAAATAHRHDDRPELNLLRYDHALSHQENLETLLATLGWYEKNIGKGIRMDTVAPVEFYEYMAKQRLGLTVKFTPRVEGVRGGGNWGLHEMRRLRSSLGVDYADDIETLGDTPEQWLNKAVRVKDEAIKQRCLGLLDRTPLVEIGKLATTPARAEFLIEHYDLSEVAETLPARVKDKVMSKRFSTDLGL